MMKLGLFLAGVGHHIASWRDPDVQSDANASLRHYIKITQIAERALFDFVFNADSNSSFGPDDPKIWQRTANAMRIEPLTLLGALSAVTSHIGLISTATTTYLDPFHVARMFATLDQMSEGRVGWNVVTSSSASEASTSAMTSMPRTTIATGALPSSSKWCRGCGTPGRTMRSSSTRPAACSST